MTGSIACSRRATEIYVKICAGVLRKGALALFVIAAFAVIAVFFGMRLPSSFLPDEDQGYAFINMQLPNAASLERTSAVAAQVEQILAKTPGVQYTTSVIGFSLLSYVRTSYNAFFFVTLKPWGERKSRAEQYQAIKAHLNGELSRLPGAFVFSFSPPAIPGVGTSGGFTFILEDRSGGDVQFLAKNLATFLDAARKRPEIAGLSTTFLPSVPQKFVQVDRDKVLKQGVALTDVYRTIQAFMGGYFINYFNRFGRQWQVYIEAEGEDRATAENVGQFYVRNNKGENVPLSTLTTIKSGVGPEFTMRFNEYRSAQINGSAAPGYSADQATAALEEVFKQTMPREMGFDYSGMSFQEQKARQGVPALGDLRTLLAVRLPDPGRAVRELVVAVQRASGNVGGDMRGFQRLVAAPYGAQCHLSGLHGANRKRCLLANRLGDADRSGREKRDSDRRICQRRGRNGEASHGCGARRGQASPASRYDDLVCLHSRLRAAVDGLRRRLSGPPNHGHHRNRRHAVGEFRRHTPRSSSLHPCGEVVRRRAHSRIVASQPTPGARRLKWTIP